MSVQQDGLFATGLSSYVRAVAEAMRVEPEAAWCEVAETSTAYVAVRERAVSHPDRDVMLLWDERVGWLVALEPRPDEQPVVLARVAADVVPEPVSVAVAVGLALRGRLEPFVTGRPEKSEPAYVRARILAYALPVLTEQVSKISRPA